MKNDELLHKWIHNTISDSELEEFRQRPEYDSLMALYKGTENMVGAEFASDEVLNNILKSRKSEVTKVRPLIPWNIIGLAASFLLIAGWLFWPSDLGEVEYLSSSEQISEKLPDNSLFTLNKGSKLTYESKGWENSRSLNLEGEAHFAVSKGSRFTVNTPSGQVAVLGTIFNVKSRNGILDVSCSEGKVEVVRFEKKVREILYANDVIRIKANGEVKKWTDANDISSSWKSGVTKLRNVPFSEVVEALERQFDIKVSTENIDLEALVTCNFQQENLSKALSTTTAALNVQFEILNKKEVIIRQ